MTALVSSEVLKLRTIRLFWIVIAVTIGLSGTIGYAAAKISADRGDPLTLTSVAVAPAQASWFLGIVLAVVASAGEFQHRTIRTTLLASPRRSRVLVAKSLVSSASGALLVALGALTAVAAAWVANAALGASSAAGGSASWSHVLGTVAVGAVWSTMAVAIGVLTRSIAIAIAAVLLWRFVGEGVLPVVGGDEIGLWMPTSLADSVIGIGSSSVASWAAGLALAAYAVAVCGLAALLFLKRDPT
ncbi:MAG TPA: ABC transporter permease [Acidothermales bacterium]